MCKLKTGTMFCVNISMLTCTPIRHNIVMVPLLLPDPSKLASQLKELKGYLQDLKDAKQRLKGYF